MWIDQPYDDCFARKPQRCDLRSNNPTYKTYCFDLSADRSLSCFAIRLSIFIDLLYLPTLYRYLMNPHPSHPSLYSSYKAIVEPTCYQSYCLPDLYTPTDLLSLYLLDLVPIDEPPGPPPIPEKQIRKAHIT